MLRRVLIIVLIMALPTAARADQPPAEKPFILPIQGDPSPSTWHVGQLYGSTTTAYRYRTTWYRGGQGLHFGLDFVARCGTEVVAIGDGYVLKVDAEEHGAGPHNLVIAHENGLASLYGHLQLRPPYEEFTPVEQGDLIGYTGDPDGTCASRPHLHLEIRDQSLYTAYNPVDFIDADWDTLLLFGPRSTYQRDLTQPHRWMTPYEQPPIQFGHSLLNNFEDPWPLPGW